MRSGRAAFYLLDVPVAFTRPIAHVIAAATEIGRAAGHDDTWVPPSLEEVVLEILLSAGSPEAAARHGMVVRPDLTGRPQADEIFCITLALEVTEDEEALIRQTRNLRPADWPETIPSACLSVLMAPVPPLDFDIEFLYLETQPPSSNHAIAARMGRIIASQALGVAIDTQG